MCAGEPFAACYWDTPDGRFFSLRSSDAGEDVSAIAQQYGGGGHRNAAGFSVPFGHTLAR
jgi:nanoRNase/pAp phosphatase (c-di-AMP/oligoRNAs hydrolase)